MMVSGGNYPKMTLILGLWSIVYNLPREMIDGKSGRPFCFSQEVSSTIWWVHDWKMALVRSHRKGPQAIGTLIYN